MLKAIRKSLDSIVQNVDLIGGHIELLSQPYAKDLMLLQIIPGINNISSVCILSEIGRDRSRFPTEQLLASRACKCPGNNESAGRMKSKRVTQ